VKVTESLSGGILLLLVLAVTDVALLLKRAELPVVPRAA
jgi:hypothetical protein